MNRSSLDNDSGLGLEIRLRQLGKLAAEVTAGNILSPAESRSSSESESTEGSSIIAPFLARICPILDKEITEKVDSLGTWRATNLAKICQLAAKTLLQELSQMHLAAHPRVMSAVISKGSLTENPVLLNMWANYLVSACTFDQDDERFISYARLLENISPGQACLLEKLAEGVEETTDKHTEKDFAQFSLSKLAELTEANDREDLQLDLANLDSLGLIDTHWQEDDSQVFIRRTALGSQFYQVTHLT